MESGCRRKHCEQKQSYKESLHREIPTGEKIGAGQRDEKINQHAHDGVENRIAVSRTDIAVGENGFIAFKAEIDRSEHDVPGAVCDA